MSNTQDDTTVSVSLTTNDWMPIAAVVLLCGILACIAVRCFADPDSALRTVCQGGALLLMVIALLVIAITLYRRNTAADNDGAVCTSDGCSVPESFADYEWGSDGFQRKGAWHPTADSQRIVGPLPSSPTANTWQYNPQNTLVDYRFYTTQPGPERVAPVAVGVRNLPNTDVTDLLGETSTRQPDFNGRPDAYVLQHPASIASFPYPTTQYVY